MSARRRHSAHPPMAAVAMPLDKLDLWLQGRTDHGAAATNLSMLDGFVTAIVAGPVSMDPPEWICPLLGIEIDAFNLGDTPDFAAISAVAVRHNAVVETLSNAPETFEPIFARKPNHEVDAGPWCEGFHAAMKLRLSALGTAQESRRHQSRSAVADPVSLRRRSGPAATRATQTGAGHRTVPANSLQGHSGRRRRNTPVLDADALQDPIVAAGHVEAHTAYGRTGCRTALRCGAEPRA
jgi:yecA family protein